MKTLKNQKGMITMITLITVLFMVSFLITSYVLVANKVKTQKEILIETKAIYEPKESMEEIYNSYFADEEEIIPIYTVEQLLSMGSDKQLDINGKIYTFLNTKAYLLIDDLEFDVDDWQHILGQNTNWTPIEETDLILDWNGHTITVTNLEGITITYGIEESEPEEGILPAEYQQVEYIKSTGSQYIDTGVVPGETIGTYVDFEALSSGTIFGAITSLNEGYYGINMYAGFEVYWGKSIGKYSNWDKEIRYLIEFNYLNNKKILVNDSSITDLTTTPSFTTNTIHLFKLNQGTTEYTQYISAKMYSAKITDGETLIRDFMPCYRKSDNKPGLYDIVNNVFYTNAGTSDDFIVASNV